MQVSDVVTFVRTLLDESNSAGRWSDAELIQFVDRSAKMLVRDMKWTESRFVFNTVATVQEYALNEVITILRVYVGGQELTRTDIPSLEGYSIQLYDQTANGSGPGGLINPGEASVLLVCSVAPQWTSQVAETYPIQNSQLGYPAPYATPWYPGRRPAWYMRGGNLGFVPPPAGVIAVVVDCVRQPSTLTQLTTVMSLPDITLDALAWKTCYFCYFSDRNSESKQLRDDAALNYKMSLADIRTWRRTYDGSGPKGIKLLEERGFFQRGGHRVGTGYRN